MLALYWLTPGVCLSVRSVYVTSRYLAGRIELAFWHRSFFPPIVRSSLFDLPGGWEGFNSPTGWGWPSHWWLKILVWGRLYGMLNIIIAQCYWILVAKSCTRSLDVLAVNFLRISSSIFWLGYVNKMADIIAPLNCLKCWLQECNQCTW